MSFYFVVVSNTVSLGGKLFLNPNDTGTEVSEGPQGRVSKEAQQTKRSGK